MQDVVERILKSYPLAAQLDETTIAESREKITSYIEKLTSAGQRDVHQLTVFGLEYLREMTEGRDPRFTGC